MTKINQITIPVDIRDNWTLVREHDKLVKESKDITWLEWNKDGTFKKERDEPRIGFSLLMSPFDRFFTWRTTFITEIIKQTPTYVEFKTTNSTYKLTKYDNKDRDKER